jgi:hypothetical protein
MKASRIVLRLRERKPRKRVLTRRRALETMPFICVSNDKSLLMVISRST